MISEKSIADEKSDTDEKFMIDKLFPEYVSLYSIELNTGHYEVLHVNANTNAKKIMDQNPVYASFDDFSGQYADTFILPEDRAEFMDWHCCKNMKRRLLRKDKLTFHYQSVSKDGKITYYEGYLAKGKTDKQSFQVFLGYRNVDSILYKEKAIQEKLQNALEETKLQNEIISAIAKTYQYISRINIKEDWYEEIANRDRKNLDFDHAGHITENNKRVCRQFVAEEYQDAFFRFTDIASLSDRMQNEETIVMEYRMKNGNWHKMRFIEKKRDENGRLTHVLCAIRSISDEKRKEYNLLHQVAEAQKDAALKTRFLSNMSHDLRTPMNGIIGMLDLANRHPDDLEMQQKCRDKIMEASKFLVSMVNDILDMNKLEAGEYADQKLDFDLTALLNRANTEKQRIAAGKQIDFVVDWKQSDLTHIYLSGNPYYLERILHVISDNAIKFTNPGGSVHVWCREKSCDKGRVLYEFVCTDNGIGMNESFLSHAFDVFSQENETSRTKYEGTGLGLAIAKRLADRMGAEITLESRKGAGTTVTVTVPFMIAKEVKQVHENREDAVSLQGMRVLVAEDNDLNMEIIRFMLEDMGLCVDCVSDGAQAVQKFEASAVNTYDVILMDILMPNLNGWDTTRKIRSMNRADAESIPIIAMSANAFPEDIINSRISGMNEHIAKPLDEEKIKNVICSCIREKIIFNPINRKYSKY